MASDETGPEKRATTEEPEAQDTETKTQTVVMNSYMNMKGSSRKVSATGSG